MKSDVTGGLQNLILSKDNVVMGNRPIWASRITDSSRISVIPAEAPTMVAVNLPNITNPTPTTENIVDAELLLPTQTEMKHVGVSLTPYKFQSFGKIVRMTVSDNQPIFNIEGVITMIANQLSLQYDRNAYLGMSAGGTTINYGLLNNPQVVVNAGVTPIADINALIGLMTDLRNQVKAATNCDDSEVEFVITGFNASSFLTRLSGAGNGYARTNISLVEEAFPYNYKVYLPTNILGTDNVMAYNRTMTSFYTGSYKGSESPSLFNVFPFPMNYCVHYDFGYCANAVSMLISGAGALQQVDYTEALESLNVKNILQSAVSLEEPVKEDKKVKSSKVNI